MLHGLCEASHLSDGRRKESKEWCENPPAPNNLPHFSMCACHTDAKATLMPLAVQFYWGGALLWCDRLEPGKCVMSRPESRCGPRASKQTWFAGIGTASPQVGRGSSTLFLPENPWFGGGQPEQCWATNCGCLFKGTLFPLWASF